MSWNVYILLCDQKTFYVGLTDNIERRVNQHNRKESFFTKKFSDVRLVYQEEYRNRATAEKRELQLKKWSIAKKKALIIGDKELLKKLSKSREVDDMLG
ncbi:MAG: GIY-YIG nuclease family protein [Candidatus Sungbacteria bacterium]|uniref:GIY-YIG nuclease family protein n=1 Tax=Candidatus Sungiibacteriota bacterium TaxID=2750080 RepID=A0A9D6LSB0_9BACT|nr:GIY-YIG nuclease family protein [Candidatus Sungbacteria bacterium]